MKNRRTLLALILVCLAAPLVSSSAMNSSFKNNVYTKKMVTKEKTKNNIIKNNLNKNSNKTSLIERQNNINNNNTSYPNYTKSLNILNKNSKDKKLMIPNNLSNMKYNFKNNKTMVINMKIRNNTIEKNKTLNINVQLENIMKELLSYEKFINNIPREKDIENIDITEKKSKIELINKKLSKLCENQKIDEKSQKTIDYIKTWIESKEISCLIIEGMKYLQNLLKYSGENSSRESCLPKIDKIHTKIKNLENKNLTQYRENIPQKYYEKTEQDIILAKNLYGELTSKYTKNNMFRMMLDQLSNYKTIGTETSENQINQLINELKAMDRTLTRNYPKANKITELQREIITDIQVWIVAKKMSCLTMKILKSKNMENEENNLRYNGIDIQFEVENLETNHLAGYEEATKPYYEKIAQDIKKAKDLQNFRKIKNLNERLEKIEERKYKDEVAQDFLQKIRTNNLESEEFNQNESLKYLK